MGTNYYASSHYLGREVHVGKSSAGWQFCFRAHDNLGISTFEDWLVALSASDITIKDEYGRGCSRREFLRKVAIKMDERNIGGDRVDHWGVPFHDCEFC